LRQLDRSVPQRLRQSRSRLIGAAPLHNLLFELRNRFRNRVLLLSHGRTIEKRLNSSTAVWRGFGTEF
jgi:hypothetical protein